MTLDIYESLTESIEAKLDAADIQAEESSERLSHDDIFDASALRQITLLFSQGIFADPATALHSKME